MIDRNHLLGIILTFIGQMRLWRWRIFVIRTDQNMWYVGRRWLLQIPEADKKVFTLIICSV